MQSCAFLVQLMVFFTFELCGSVGSLGVVMSMQWFCLQDFYGTFCDCFFGEWF
jgi:hypothetical protein